MCLNMFRICSLSSLLGEMTPVWRSLQDGGLVALWRSVFVLMWLKMMEEMEKNEAMMYTLDVLNNTHA